MAGRRKKKAGYSSERDNAERWLLTYADMITLLVAFFIMLYAMSVMNQQKFQQLAISVRSGFGSSLGIGGATLMPGGGVTGNASLLSSGRPTDSSADNSAFPMSKGSLAARVDSDRLDKAYAVIHTYIQKNGLQNVMHVSREERGVVVTVMTDKMLFARGQADIRPEELGLLNHVAAVINTVPNQVRVEGHTDNLPIHTPRFPSNWELSTTRATTVLRYFETRRIASQRLEAAGYADQHPVASNATEYGRGCNRRVDVVILRQL